MRTHGTILCNNFGWGDLMGDTKSKKDKAKGKKQSEAKHAKVDQQKKDKQKAKAS